MTGDDVWWRVTRWRVTGDAVTGDGTGDGRWESPEQRRVPQLVIYKTKIKISISLPN